MQLVRRLVVQGIPGASASWLRPAPIVDHIVVGAVCWPPLLMWGALEPLGIRVGRRAPDDFAVTAADAVSTRVTTILGIIARAPPRGLPRTAMAVVMLPSLLFGITLPGAGDLTASVLGYIEIGIQVWGRGIGFDRFGKFEVKSLVDELPTGDVSPVNEGDGDALGAGAASAANAVNVSFFVLGTLMVDDVGYPGDVNATGSDIGRHQNGYVAMTEPFESLLTGDLCEITVDGAGFETTVVEVVRKPLARTLGAAEDNDLLGVIGLQNASNDFDLVEGMGLIYKLLGVGNGGLSVGSLCANVNWTVQLRPGQSHNRGRHSGRKQHGLARGRSASDEIFDVGQETEIQHLVGLVKDDDVHVG